MEQSRDDFVIAIRSAFLKKGAQQRFSIFSLILFSIIFLIFGSFNLKIIDYVKIVIKDTIYVASFIATIPENLIKQSYKGVSGHYQYYGEFKSIKSQLEELKTKDLSKQIIVYENIKLKKVIDDYFVTNNETYAKVLIDKESPFLKSIILNKGSKNKIKIGMIVLDDIYLIGKVVEVNYLTSRVLLVSDINSKVPVSVEPIGLQAIMSGTGKENAILQYKNLENMKDIDNKTKDFLVVTSGAGSVFNSGIPVGKINKEIDINKDEINVSFFKDFTQLKYVKIVSNEKVIVDQPNKEEFEINSKQVETISNQKKNFDILKQQKNIVDEIRVRIEDENTNLKQKLQNTQNELKKAENRLNKTKISEEELVFLKLNYLHGHKCRKNFYNNLHEIGSPEYKACVLKKAKVKN